MAFKTTSVDKIKITIEVSEFHSIFDVNNTKSDVIQIAEQLQEVSNAINNELIRDAGATDNGIESFLKTIESRLTGSFLMSEVELKVEKK